MVERARNPHGDGLEEVSCAICGERQSDELFSGEDRRLRVDSVAYTLRRCRSCAHVYLSPRPDGRTLSRYYPETYYSPRIVAPTTRRSKWTAIGSRRPERANREKLRIVEAVAPERGLLLDIGCAAGDFLETARSAGWQVAGVEFDEKTARWVRENKGIDVRTGSAETLDLPANISVCTFWSSLEHLTEPRLVLERALEFLAPGGFAVVFVPNFGCWESRLSGRHWPHLDIPRHLHQFERESLRRILEAAGYRVCSISTPFTSIEITHWNSVPLRRRRLPHRVDRAARILLSPLHYLLCALAAATDNNHSLLAIAQRRHDSS
jgi:SAM-dependent methyltransferase